MASSVKYSFLERLLHRTAFAAPTIQFTAADVETAAFRAVYRPFLAARPIFITSLPRAGTTVLLQALSRFPSVATHLYRDMPFVLAPLLWSRVSRGFRTRAVLRERAHGDGVQVSEDSPEAFEEILWRAFWPEKYSDTGIELWGADDEKEEARNFFVDHMKKLVALRRPDRPIDGRYLSKNNANIARLDLLRRMFADAKIVVPVRDPIEQASSLLHQHRRFLEMHQQEPFVQRYMGDIGHFEFGRLHRPIRFPGVDALLLGRNALTLDYWVSYWIAAFEHVLARRRGLVVVSYEAICANPQEQLHGLLTALDIDAEGTSSVASSIFRPPPPRRHSGEPIEAALRERAERLHAELLTGA